MPVHLEASHLSWTTPDGRVLFSDLDLSFADERTGLVGRNGVGKTTLLKLLSGELSPQTGTVSAAGRLGVLRQSVHVAGDETVADALNVREPLAVLRRAEVGEATAEDLAVADWLLEARIEATLGRVGLNVDTDARLAALSGGQRTRVRLAALLLAEPDFLLLDEPTNDLDREGRRAVIDLLAEWRGGAIVVSHDRELLDVMDAIVELTSLGATRYGGNWTLYRERKSLELAAVERDLAEAEKQIAEAARSAQERSERQARSDRAGRQKAAKGDLPRILLGARKNRAEATTGENARLAEKRRAQAANAAAAARERIEILQPLNVSLPKTGLSPSKVVLKLDGVTAGYDAERPIIRDLSFDVVGPERIATVGPNGSGKTTLLAIVAGRLAPWSGSVRVNTPAAMLDQRVSLLDPAASIRDNFRRLNPTADENACRATLARFMFRSDAALQVVGTLSGGQLLRAGLACVLGGPTPPPLVILDEPTNHLDVDSIEAVEAGLRAYDGALLVVSHDERFLDAIGVARRIELPTIRSDAGS